MEELRFEIIWASGCGVGAVVCVILVRGGGCGPGFCAGVMFWWFDGDGGDVY